MNENGDDDNNNMKIFFRSYSAYVCFSAYDETIQQRFCVNIVFNYINKSKYLRNNI